MTRFVYYTAATLDGFLADEHDSLDWLFVQEQDESASTEHPWLSYERLIAQTGAMVMGATTYQWVVDHLAESDEAWPYDMPCFVFTHRDLAPVAPTVELVATDVAESAQRIVEAAGEGDVWVVGGGDLAAQFAEAGHLDEVILNLAPVTLGAGRPLFPRRRDLQLLDLVRNGAFIGARYAVGRART